MKIYFRTSDGGFKKTKPSYINFENCFENLMNVFKDKVPVENVTLIADKVSNDTYLNIEKSIAKHKTNDGRSVKFLRTDCGSSAGGFNKCLDLIYQNETDPNEIIYLVENDYIHREGSFEAIEDALINLGTDFCTLYCHPDKFIPASKGGNPLVSEDGGQVTKVFRGKAAFWMLTDSTTCTFAVKFGTLKEVEHIIRQYTIGVYPEDLEIFHDLRRRGYSLIQPLPTFATHGETAWLSPLVGTEYQTDEGLVGWEKIINKK